jgi:hypothetical protein
MHVLLNESDPRAVPLIHSILYSIVSGCIPTTTTTITKIMRNCENRNHSVFTFTFYPVTSLSLLNELANCSIHSIEERDISNNSITFSHNQRQVRTETERLDYDDLTK